MPIAAVQVIGPHKGADGAVVAHAAAELLTGEIDVVDRQHRRHLQLVRAVLDKIVQPVIVGAAENCGSMSSRARYDRPAVGNSTAMSIPYISMPMTWATAS